MTNIIWQGTVDNMELAGQPNGDKQPARIVESANGELMTEFASATENEAGEIEYDQSAWFSDYQIRFRDMEPPIDEALRTRLLDAKLLDA